MVNSKEGLNQWKCVCVSHSVVSGSLKAHGLEPTRFPIHGILQASILECVAISFSREFSQSRDWTQVSLIAGRLFIDWATREVLIDWKA